METNRIFSEQIEIILSQPFIKLTEGLQAFIYISKDGKYILKTFKNLEQSKEQFKKWGLNPDDINHELIENSDKSYRLAFDKLRKETGLICIRLSNEPLPVEKIIIDNKEYVLSDLQFLLQEKVELVRDRIAKFIDANDIAGAKKVIDDIINLIDHIWKKNITEDTFNWDHNYGYTSSGNLVQIDVGTFREGKKYIKEEIKARKLLDSVSFSKLKERFPQLVEYYQQKAEKFYREFNYIDN